MEGGRERERERESTNKFNNYPLPTQGTNSEYNSEITIQGNSEITTQDTFVNSLESVLALNYAEFEELFILNDVIKIHWMIHRQSLTFLILSKATKMKRNETKRKERKKERERQRGDDDE